MRLSFGRVVATVGIALLAIVFTLAVNGLWSLLLAVNLATTPALPWAVVAMALLLWLLWRYAGGAGWPRRTAAARRRGRRANPVAPAVFWWAILAGGLALVALIGLWLVLTRLAPVPGNRLPDFSRYPPLTVALALAMASLVAALAEEVGVRGYAQGALERRVYPPVAIVLVALAIAPGHAQTQGFVWSVALFYLLVDVMLGAMARLTDTILPGIAVHGIGIFIFFTLIWPSDATRRPVLAGGPDGWFWLNAVQAILFAALAILAFVRLARMTEDGRNAPVRPAAEASGMTHEA